MSANPAETAHGAPSRAAGFPGTTRLGRRIVDASTTQGDVQPLELIVIIGVLVLLALAAYGGYVRSAGFVTDDWAVRSTWLIRTDGGHLSHFWNFVQLFLGERPALGVYLGVTQAILGFHQHMYIALALGTAVLLSAAFYLFLRSLRFTPVNAGVIAVLTLIFPPADSLRLWPIMGDGSWALMLLVLGAVVTLRSLKTAGRRMWELRAAGLVLYALSLLTYEIGLVLVAATSVLLYRCVAPWRRSLVAWAQDIVVVLLVYVFAIRQSNAHQELGLSGTIAHTRYVAGAALKLFATQVIPLGIGEGWVLALVAVVIGLSVLAVRLLPADDPTRSQLRRWLIVIAVSTALTTSAYAIYAPGALYDPLATGLGNRTNALPALPLATIAYALGALVFLLAARFPLRHLRPWTSIGPALIGVVLGASYLSTTHQHANEWKSAYQQASGVLYVMARHMPQPPPGSMVLAFGQPIWSQAGLPIWSTTWDISGAVQSLYNDNTLDALPAFPGTTIACGRTSAGPTDPAFAGGYSPIDSRPYGKLYLFSVDGNWAAPQNRQECQQLRKTFVPGPWNSPVA